MEMSQFSHSVALIFFTLALIGSLWYGYQARFRGGLTIHIKTALGLISLTLVGLIVFGFQLGITLT